LGITDPSTWIYIVDKEIQNLSPSKIDRLIVHFDLYSQLQKNGLKVIHNLIRNSTRISILTICVTSEILIQRNSLRLSGLLKISFHLPKRYWRIILRFLRLLNKRKLYKQGFSASLYEQWFAFFKDCKVTNHWLLDFDEPNNMEARPYETHEVGVYTRIP